ncbi:damage-control phosphatase ARMT1 family protein [Streptomyces sp. NPDC092296]|uniref:damage-control phosphatase ARMT1 family protein n=1 Tax=Streptomyces sp. NPDC092296 TaxID=3366012 RepID=UPI00381D9C89
MRSRQQAAPVITGGTPGSFPWRVFHERHPLLLRQVADGLPYGPAQRRELERLLTESTSGVIEPLEEGARDATRWVAWGGGEQYGRRWTEAPFLWAESYFYRRLLSAVGWFGPGPWQGVDPFGPVKAAELAGPAVDAELAALDELATLPDERQDRALLLSSLWGNRADLGFRLTAGPAADAGADAGSPLLGDDSALLLAALEQRPPGRLALVADNAGRELLPDLVLIDRLLHTGRVTAADLHVKPCPYYVSDATTADAVAAVRRLRDAPGAAGRIGGRLWRALADGTLRIGTHPFFSAPLPFEAMPDDLRAALGSAALTVVKGDLNYRRLVGDRHWPVDTPFAALTGWFPGAVAALRTLKSEVAVGVDPAVAARLDAAEPGWRTSGAHAVIQLGGALG